MTASESAGACDENLSLRAGLSHDPTSQVAAGFGLPHTASMTSPSPYRVPLDALEATAHVAPEDLVESVDVQPEPPADSRGEQPDRDWFAAGG
jgi:hypothetical protein